MSEVTSLELGRAVREICACAEQRIFRTCLRRRRRGYDGGTQWIDSLKEADKDSLDSNLLNWDTVRTLQLGKYVLRLVVALGYMNMTRWKWPDPNDQMKITRNFRPSFLPWTPQWASAEREATTRVPFCAKQLIRVSGWVRTRLAKLCANLPTVVRYRPLPPSAT